MYSTPNTVFQRQKCVSHWSENCRNQENIQTVNCNGLYRQMCRKIEPATTQGAAYRHFYCITYMDMLRRQEGKTNAKLQSSETSDKSPCTTGLVDKLWVRSYYIILYYCIYEVYTHTTITCLLKTISSFIKFTNMFLI
jgi:hypothetical protein